MSCLLDCCSQERSVLKLPSTSRGFLSGPQSWLEGFFWLPELLQSFLFLPKIGSYHLLPPIIYHLLAHNQCTGLSTVDSHTGGSGFKSIHRHIVFFPIDLLSSFSLFVDMFACPTNTTTQCKLQCVQDGFGSLQLALVVFLLSPTNAKITYTCGGHHLQLSPVVVFICQIYT